MTENEIASLLIDSFQKQISLYRELEELAKSCEMACCSSKNQQELLPLLKQKKEKIDKITEINLAAEQAKKEWQESKNQWTETDLKKRVEDCLSRLTEQISRTIGTEKHLEELLQKPSQRAQATAAGKYKAQGL